MLFCEADVKFVQDGDRSPIIAAEREKYSNLIREIYVSHGYYPISLSGNYTERYEKAVMLVEDMLR